MNALLAKLNLQESNPGACYGPDGWIADADGALLTSYNPATGEAIAHVVQTTAPTYDTVVTHAHAAFASWRTTPAPNAGLSCAIWAMPCAI
jgi:aldehyde dehydrogenase (NAD+)